MPKKKKRTRKIKKVKKSNSIIILILLVLLLVLLIGGYILLNKNNSNKSDKNEVINLKENELLYDGYIYTLPEGWKKNEYYTTALNVIFNTSEDGVDSYSGGIINITTIASTGKTKKELFYDTAFFEESLKESKTGLDVGEGTLIVRDDTPVVIFPCEYVNGNNSKVLLAFMPEDDEYFYNIQFYSNRVVDYKDELYFNYEGLYSFVDFLNTRVKQESRLIKAK